MPPIDAGFSPEPSQYASLPRPEQSRHWLPQAEEPGYAVPPAWMDRGAVAPVEAAPAPKQSFRSMASMPMERSRERTPLSAATAPPLSTPRTPEPALTSRVVEPRPDPDFDTEEIADDIEPEKNRKSALPKLLKRLMTAGRTEFPAIPEFVSAEDEMAATATGAQEIAAPLPVAAQAAPHIAPVPASSPMPKVEYTPAGDNLNDLRLAHRDLRNTVTEQSGVLERVQDQVQMLCESADRSAQEQQQLVGELKFFSKWAFVFAIAVALLLFASVAFDVVLLLRQ